jgi:hypothetical protein
MNNIKIVLLTITVFSFTTIFFIDGSELFKNTMNSSKDESEEFFKSEWKQDLKKIKKQGNWNFQINRPTQQWVNKAVESAFYKITDNKKVSVEKLVKDLKKTLDTIYITHDENTHKNYVQLKDIQYINKTVNSFTTQLCKKIECKEKLKRKEKEKKEKEYLSQQNIFNQLLQNIEASYWYAIPSENWQNSIVKQAEKLIEQESTLNISGFYDNSIILKINEALNLHIKKYWFPDNISISIIRQNIEIDIKKLLAKKEILNKKLENTQSIPKIVREKTILTIVEKQELQKEERN